MRKSTEIASITDVKMLLILSIGNIEVTFSDDKTSDWRRSLCGTSHPVLYADMSLSEMKQCLEVGLRDEGIEPNERRFADLKKYYEQMKDKTAPKERE